MKRVNMTLPEMLSGIAQVGRMFRYFVFTVLFVLSNSVLASSAVFTASDSLWGQSGKGLSLFEDTPEFLPVDQAFQYSFSLDDSGRLRLNWDIEEGYYLYEDRLTIKDSEGNNLSFERSKGSPIEKDDPAFGLVQVYYDQWTVLLSPSTAGEIKVQYQGCADAGLCYPPTRKTAYWEGATTDQLSGSSLNDSSLIESELNETSSIFASGFVMTVLMFLGIGLGLAFTPCVLPMLPILSSVVVNHQGHQKHSAFVVACAYVLGMALTYSALGVAMAGFGDAVQMQAWLQQPWVVAVFAAIFIALALAMFGLYELQVPEFIRSKLTGAGDNSRNHGVFGCLLLGAVSALVVSPCVSGPLAGVLIYISTTQDMLLGGVALFAMALGMGIPLMAIVLGGRNVLPSAGVWMEQVKVIFGVLLLLMAVYLVKHLFATEWLALAVSFILIVFCCWAGVFSSSTNNLYRGILVVVLIYGLSLMASGLSSRASFSAPLSFISGQQVDSAVSQETLSVVKVSPGPELEAVMEEARLNGQAVMLDVLADWCVSCFVMEREILVKPDVKTMMSDVEIIKVDITNVAELNAKFLQDNNLFGPPAFLFYGQDGSEVGRIVGEVNKAEFKRYFSDLSF